MTQYKVLFFASRDVKETLLYQHVQIFPEVLGHEAKEGEEGPSKAVEAGVTIVGVPSSFHTRKALWTPSEIKNLPQQMTGIYL